jgi:hypothetical protein
MISLYPTQDVQSRIYRIRGQQVMLSLELAFLYGVQTKVLIQAVKRNLDRFPPDFMFQLSAHEWQHLKSQIVTSSWGGIRRAIPYAFTEQGIAMLSSVLRSHEAIQINVAIMRAFVKLRHAVLAHQGIARRVEKLEGKVSVHDTDIRLITQDLRELKRDRPVEDKPFKGFTKD